MRAVRLGVLHEEQGTARQVSNSNLIIFLRIAKSNYLLLTCNLFKIMSNFTQYIE